MNEQIKKRIEQIRRGEVPEGYNHEKVGIIPQEWKIISVGKCVREYKMLSNDVQNIPVYSSSRKGLVPQSEYYDQKEVVETNLGYKIVPRGYVTYRHMSDDDIFHFNINNTGTDILVSSEYPVFTASQRANVGFLIPILNETARFRYFCRTQKLGGTRTRLYFKNLEEYHMGIPPLPEQQKIAAILTTQDKVIELKEKRIAQKQRQKKYLMQQLLTGKKRLKGFSGEWGTVKLKSVLKVGQKKPVENTSKYRKITIKLNFGGIEFARTNRKMADTRPFYTRKSGELIIGKQNYFNGSVAIVNNEFDGSICSNAIMSFFAEAVEIQYVYYYITQVDFMKKREYLANGTGQKELSEKDFLDFEIMLPSLPEQTAIVKALSTADSEISLLQKDLEQEKLKKKALMQLLLTGIVRVSA